MREGRVIVVRLCGSQSAIRPRSRDLTYRITFDERDENGKQRSVVRLITGADAVNLDAPDVIVAQGTTGETVTT
jgi:hypothetical protein